MRIASFGWVSEVSSARRLCDRIVEGWTLTEATGVLIVLVAIEL